MVVTVPINIRFASSQFNSEEFVRALDPPLVVRTFSHGPEAVARSGEWIRAVYCWTTSYSADVLPGSMTRLMVGPDLLDVIVTSIEWSQSTLTRTGRIATGRGQIRETFLGPLPDPNWPVVRRPMLEFTDKREPLLTLELENPAKAAAPSCNLVLSARFRRGVCKRGDEGGSTYAATLLVAGGSPEQLVGRELTYQRATPCSGGSLQLALGATGPLPAGLTRFRYRITETLKSPGLDLRWHVGDSFTIGAEGGRTFALFSASQAGWFGGGQAALRLGRVTAAFHAQVRTDPWYGSRRAWLSVRTGL